MLNSAGIKAIADDGSSAYMLEVGPRSTGRKIIPTNYINKLLILMLMAAISGPEREKYVGNITQLDAGVQAEIAEIIKQKQKEVDGILNAAPTPHEPEQLAPTSNDFELEFEERYASLITQKKALELDKEKLKKEIADMATRLGRLQENNGLLQERLTTAEEGLRTVARDGDTAKVIRNLEAKIREQDDLIANQEGQVEQDRLEKLRMRKELERLASANERAVQLEDEVKELKY